MRAGNDIAGFITRVNQMLYDASTFETVTVWPYGPLSVIATACL